MDEVFKQAIESYPYPIAYKIKLSVAIDIRVEPRKKLDQILDTAEEIAKFIGAAAVLELINYCKDNRDYSLPGSIKNNFKNKIIKPSFGNWIQLGRDGFKFLSEQDKKVAIENLQGVYYKSNGRASEFQEAVNELNQMRNNFGHEVDKVKLTKKKYAGIARIALNLLKQMVAEINFLANVSFGYIETIELKKSKRDAPKYLYKGKELKGREFIKETTGLLSDQVYYHYKETNAVVIKFEAEKNYLNLFPFYIYDEDHGDASDIFIYSSANNAKMNEIKYLGCAYGGTLKLEKNKRQPKQNSTACQEIIDGPTNGEISDNWRDIVDGKAMGQDNSEDDLNNLVREELKHILNTIT